MIYNGITTSIAGSSYSLTVEPAVSTLKNGDVLIVTFHEASPKDPALIIGGNPITIKNRTGKVFYMGDIKKNMVMTLGYNETDNCFYTSETLVSGKRLQDIDKKIRAHPESIVYSHDTNEFANGDKTKSDFTIKMHELAGDIVSSNYFVHDKAGLDIVVGDPKIKGFVLKNGYRITILFSALPKANFSIKLHDTPAIPGGDESFQKLITIDSHCAFEYNETANKWFLMRDSLYLLRTGTTPMEGDLDMNDKIIKKAKIDKPGITGGYIINADGILNTLHVNAHLITPDPVNGSDEGSVISMGGNVDGTNNWRLGSFGGKGRSIWVLVNTDSDGTVGYALWADARAKTLYSFGKLLATQEYVNNTVVGNLKYQGVIMVDNKVLTDDDSGRVLVVLSPTTKIQLPPINTIASGRVFILKNETGADVQLVVNGHTGDGISTLLPNETRTIASDGARNYRKISAIVPIFGLDGYRGVGNAIPQGQTISYTAPRNGTIVVFMTGSYRSDGYFFIDNMLLGNWGDDENSFTKKYGASYPIGAGQTARFQNVSFNVACQMNFYPFRNH